MKEVEKRGSPIDLYHKEYPLAVRDVFEKERIEELKNVEYNDLEDMVYGKNLKNTEFIDLLNVENTAGTKTGYTLPTGVFKYGEFNTITKSLFPSKAKVNATAVDIRMRIHLTNKNTIEITTKSFSNKILGITIGV